MKTIFWILILALIGSSLIISSPVESGPPSSIPPPAPKTRNQIAAEAYAIESSVKNLAGRKTNPSNDGIGPSSNTGCAPNPVGMSCTANTTWNQYSVKLCGAQTWFLSPTHPVLTLQITNSKIDGCGLGGVLTTNDTTATPFFVWDGSTAFTITISNSTLSNFTTFIKHDTSYYRIGATVIRLQNDTISNFDETIASRVVQRTILSQAWDLTISGYNRDNLSYCAVASNPEDESYKETLSAAIYRTRFIDTSGHFSGCAWGDNIHIAKDNYFEGGFLQLVYGGQGEHGVSPNFLVPTEIVNWSHNYANGSLHTVFGLYGRGTGKFSDHFGRNAVATISGNYVNNSRYIPYQISGNQTGIREIGNYIRGPSPWPGGTPTFEIAFLIGEQNHDNLVSGNHLWDMDQSQIVGIDVGFSAYNITVSNNILYDIGSNHIRVEGSILKYKIASNGTEASDYSWTGNNVTFRGNYISGGTGSPAISVDSGYIHFFSNIVVNVNAGAFIVRKGFGCSNGLNQPCNFAWIDWIDGYPDIPTIVWSGTILPADEANYWLRSMRTGSITDSLSAIQTVFSVSLTTADSTHFGSLVPRCVQNSAATFSHTTTDQEIFLWSGHSCGAVSDTTTFAFSNSVRTYIAIEPERWYNKTRNVSFDPVVGNVGGTFEMAVIEPGYGVDVSNGISRNWIIVPGHPYIIQTPELSLGKIMDWTRLLVFFGLLTLGLVGAFAIKRRRNR